MLTKDILIGLIASNLAIGILTAANITTAFSLINDISKRQDVKKSIALLAIIVVCFGFLIFGVVRLANKLPDNTVYVGVTVSKEKYDTIQQKLTNHETVLPEEILSSSP